MIRNAARIALELATLAFLVQLGQIHAEPKDAPTKPVEARGSLLDPPPPCHAWVSDGAIDGESREARLERLEAAVRLTRAEMHVNGKRK